LGAFFAKQKNGLFRVPRQSATYLVGSAWFDYARQTHRPSTPPAPLQSLAQISGGGKKIFSLANALEVQPYELLLPPQTSISYDTKRTKDLMNRLRKNLGEVVDTLEDFLGKK
jgi:hypothetical protein